jgi:cytochrome c556
MRHVMLSVLAIVGIVAVAEAQTGGAAGVIQSRQANYKQIAGAVRTIGNQLKADQPDIASIRQATALVADRAPRVSGWFPAGTGPEAGIRTRALPAIWANPDDFRAKAVNFVVAARALDDAARRGDLAAVRTAFPTLGRACGSCHESYRAPEHD